MSKEKAFPRTGIEYSDGQKGMELRDYFAIRILCELNVGENSMTDEYLVHHAYSIADIMMQRREE